jgi:hypothetical protein
VATRDDGGSKQASSGGRRRLAKGPRTGGVGRTGARFPSATDVRFVAPEPQLAEPIVPIAEVDADEDVEVGRTGARFGPPAARKPKSGKPSEPGPPPPAPSAASSSGSGRGHAGSSAYAAGRDGSGHGGADWPVAQRASLAERGPSSIDLYGVAPLPPTRPDGRPSPTDPAERAPLPWASAIVRPYAHTGGRTRSSHDLAIEALISTSGVAAVADTTPQRRLIMEMCARPRSVAEVAALLSVPLGVARVLLGDLATDGSVIVHPTASAGAAAPDVDMLHRVLVGLRRL